MSRVNRQRFYGKSVSKVVFLSIKNIHAAEKSEEEFFMIGKK